MSMNFINQQTAAIFIFILMDCDNLGSLPQGKIKISSFVEVNKVNKFKV